MDPTQLPTVLFLCDVRARCHSLYKSKGMGSETISYEIRTFQETLDKYKANKIKSTTMIKRGNSFLRLFPDLQARFWELMSDPRANVRDAPEHMGMTGRFAPLHSHLVWQHIVHLLPHSAAARMASSCRWLSRMVTPRLLVHLRQSSVDRLSTPVVGGSAPLRLGTVDGQSVALYIIFGSGQMLGMGYGGRYYVLDTYSVQDPTRIGWTFENRVNMSLFQLLDRIAKAPPGEPLDLRMWARVLPLPRDMLRLEITAHGEFDQIGRAYEDEGVKYQLFGRGELFNWCPQAEEKTAVLEEENAKLRRRIAELEALKSD